MRPGHSSADRRRRRTRRHGRLDALAVAVLAALTVVLWVVAVPAARGALTRAGADTVSAQVAQCPQQRVLAPPCEVTFTQQGATVTRALHQGTLFGVEPGERIEVHPLDDGTVAIGGWRAFADTALLVLLALALTSYTLRRWTRLAGPGPAPSGGTGRDDALRRDADPPPRRGSRAHPAA